MNLSAPPSTLISLISFLWPFLTSPPLPQILKAKWPLIVQCLLLIDLWNKLKQFLYAKVSLVIYLLWSPFTPGRCLCFFKRCLLLWWHCNCPFQVGLCIDSGSLLFDFLQSLLGMIILYLHLACDRTANSLHYRVAPPL